MRCVHLSMAKLIRSRMHSEHLGAVQLLTHPGLPAPPAAAGPCTAGSAARAPQGLSPRLHQRWTWSRPRPQMPCKVRSPHGGASTAAAHVFRHARHPVHQKLCMRGGRPCLQHTHIHTRICVGSVAYACARVDECEHVFAVVRVYAGCSM